MCEANAKATYILRSVPKVLGDAERSRPAPPEKISLDRVHAPLKRPGVIIIIMHLRKSPLKPWIYMQGITRNDCKILLLQFLTQSFFTTRADCMISPALTYYLNFRPLTLISNLSIVSPARQRVLQRMLPEGHAGLLVDTGQQVLESFFRSQAGKWPSSHMGQHLCAAVVARYTAIANSLVQFPAVAKPD